MILTVGRHHCPAHPDRTPSLSVRREADRWLIHCFAGCPPEAILRAAGLTFADLFDSSPPPSRRVPRRQAWRDSIEAPLIAREGRAEVHLEPWLPVYHVADFIRRQRT